MSDKPTSPAITRETLLAHLHLLKAEDVAPLLKPQLVLVGNVTSSAFYKIRIGSKMFNFIRSGRQHILDCASLGEMELVQQEVAKQRSTPAFARVAIVLPQDPEKVAAEEAAKAAAKPVEPRPIDPALVEEQNRQVRRAALARMSEDYLRKKAAELNIVGYPTHGQKEALVDLVLEAELAGDTIVEPEPAPEPVTAPPTEPLQGDPAPASEVATLPMEELRKHAAANGVEGAEKLSRRDILKALKK